MHLTKEPTQPTSKDQMTMIVLAVSSGMIGWLFSGAVHEFGHALAVLGFGGQITEIQPLALVGAPHISYQGSFNELERAVISLSGMGLVFLTGVAVGAIYPFKQSAIKRNLAVIFAIIPFVSQLLSYIILPLLHMAGANIRDDVISFLNYSQIHPLLVSILAAALFTSTVAVLNKRVNIIQTIQTISADE